MSSGVLVNSECQTVFQQLSEGKHHKLRYIIYKIEDKEVVVEAAVSPDEVSFATFEIWLNMDGGYIQILKIIAIQKV